MYIIFAFRIFDTSLTLYGKLEHLLREGLDEEAVEDSKSHEIHYSCLSQVSKTTELLFDFILTRI